MVMTTEERGDLWAMYTWVISKSPGRGPAMTVKKSWITDRATADSWGNKSAVAKDAALVRERSVEWESEVGGQL